MSKLKFIKNNMGEISLFCEMQLPNTPTVNALAEAARVRNLEAVLLAAIQLKHNTHNAKAQRLCNALIPPLIGGVLKADLVLANICQN